MERVKKLVKRQYEEMNLESKKISWDSKQVLLINRCQMIIIYDWGISNQNLWDMVDECVRELIPDEYEEDSEE